jgi:hypothetical protein
LFATNGTFTTLSVTNLGVTGLTWTNATGTNTTSTNLFATNLLFSNSTGTSQFVASLGFTTATGTSLNSNQSAIGIGTIGTIFTATGTVTSLNFVSATGSTLGLLSLVSNTVTSTSITANIGTFATATVMGSAVCLASGVGCPSGTVLSDTLQSVTARGSFTTTTVQFFGGLTASNITATGTSSLQGTTFTNATGTSVTTTNLGVTDTATIGNATASTLQANIASFATATVAGQGICLSNGQFCSTGSTPEADTLQTVTNRGAFTTTTLSLFGGLTASNISATGTLNVTGVSTLTGVTFTNATGTNVTSTNLFATNLLYTASTGTSAFVSSFGFTTASGTSLAANIASFATATVAGRGVCLSDGTFCPASTAIESDTLLTVSNRGSIATTTLTLFGGFVAASSSVTGTLNVMGNANIGAATTSLNTAFVQDGNDLYVEGNIGVASSIYTNGEFVAGPSSTHYADGRISKVDNMHEFTDPGNYALEVLSTGGILLQSAADTVNAAQGSIGLYAGDGTSTLVAGGELIFQGGAAYNEGAGGSVSITGGGSGTSSLSTAGSVSINGGSSNSNGAGGNVNINGSDTFGSGNAGSLNLLAGTAYGSGNAGSISLTAGTSYNSSDGGDITLYPGLSTGGGRTGNVVLQSGFGYTPPELRFNEDQSFGGNYVGFRAPTSVAANRVWILPAADGSSGQVLSTDGLGNLSFISAGGGSATTTDFNWIYSNGGNFVRNATATVDLLLGSSATSTGAPAFFDLVTGTSTFYFGYNTNTNVVIGSSSTTINGLPLFTMNGNDLLVSGSIGTDKIFASGRVDTPYLNRWFQNPLLTQTIYKGGRAQVPVGSDAREVIFDGSHIWVSNYDNTVATINKIDPLTSTVIATTTLPGSANNVDGMAYDGKYLWAVAEEDPTGYAYKIDIHTNQVIATVNLGSTYRFPEDIVFDGTYLWVTQVGTFPAVGGISKIDPNTNSLVTQFGLDSGTHGVAFDGTYLWAANQNDATVSKISPTTSAVVATTTGILSANDVVYDGSYVWVSSAFSDLVYKIDPNTNTVVASVSLINTSNNAQRMAYDGQFIWVALAGTSTVAKIDPRTNTVSEKIEIHGFSRSIAVDGSHVWITNEFSTSDYVTRIPYGASPAASASSGGLDTLQSATARGSFTTTTAQFFGGFVAASSSVTGTLRAIGTFSVTGTSFMQGTFFTNATGTNVTTTNLFFSGATGTTLSLSRAALGNSTATNLFVNTTLGFLNGTGTTLNADILSVATGTVSNLNFFNTTGTFLSATTGTLRTVTSTFLYANTANFATATVSGVGICLSNGVGCPSSSESDTLLTVSNRGSIATSTFMLFGGFVAASSSVTGTLNVLGMLHVTGTSDITLTSTSSPFTIRSPQPDPFDVAKVFQYFTTGTQGVALTNFNLFGNLTYSTLGFLKDVNNPLATGGGRINYGNETNQLTLSVSADSSNATSLELTDNDNMLSGFGAEAAVTIRKYTNHATSSMLHLWNLGSNNSESTIGVGSDDPNYLIGGYVSSLYLRSSVTSGTQAYLNRGSSTSWYGIATVDMLPSSSTFSQTRTFLANRTTSTLAEPSNFTMTIGYSSDTTMGGLCIDDTFTGTACPTTNIDGASIMSDGPILANAFDIAEFYSVTGTAEAGDVLVLDASSTATVRQSNGVAYDSNIIGVVSTAPGFVLGWDGGAKVALAGRVPVKISMNNGEIHVGDALVSSDVPGYAMKATQPGMILGYALEDVSTTGTGQIFVSVGFWAGVAFGPTGAMQIDQSGNVSVMHDLHVGGRLFPSLKGGGIQNDWYLFVNDDDATSTYISTNADGWMSMDTYDFAERYYSPDELEPGDLVVVSDTGRTHVQRSMDADTMLLGIVSTRPAFIAGRPATSTYPIALSGRVPTKVSGINGAIKAGDPLAPTTIPGVAAKAVHTGSIVGLALEDYDGADVGKIEVFVNPTTWINKDELAAVIAPEPTTPSQIVVTNDKQGFATVLAGSKKVRIEFPSLGAYPNVQVTPRGSTGGEWWTDSYTDTGFEIIIAQAQDHDVVFAWRVEATTASDVMRMSDGTYATVDPLTGQPIGLQGATSTTEILEPEPIPEPEPETSVIEDATTTEDLPTEEVASSTESGA